MRRCGLAGFAIALVSGTALTAQSQTVPVFRTRQEAVRLDLLVTDGGRPVRGLAASDFEVRDNGVPQTVALFSPEQAPISLLLVLDTSGSVRGPKLQALVEAARVALDSLAPGDSAGLVTFSQRIELAAEPTADTAIVRTALDRMEGSGSTALIDAVHAAVTLADAETRRALMLVFSDGRDNVSWLPGPSVLETLRRFEVVTYFVTPSLEFLAVPLQQWSARDEPDENFLIAAARVTGGRVLTAASSGALRSAFHTIIDEFKSRYLLSYTPTGVERIGWHRVEVKLGRGRKGSVTARPGYMVDEPRR